MMKHLTSLVLGGVFGSLLLVGNAEAGHHKKAACAAPVAYAPVACAPAPVACAPAPVACAPKVKKHHGVVGLCHKKKPAVACAGPVVAYSAPVQYGVAPTGQYYASPQGSA